MTYREYILKKHNSTDAEKALNAPSMYPTWIRKEIFDVCIREHVIPSEIVGHRTATTNWVNNNLPNLDDEIKR